MSKFGDRKDRMEMGVGGCLKLKSLSHLLFSSNTLRPNHLLLSPSLCFSTSPISALCDTRVSQPVTHAQTNNNKLLQVVLVSPQIPGNSGSIARTCAAAGVKLHLVEPMGFAIDHTKLKRAGLDYWPYVVVKVHPSWTHFRDYFLLQDGDKRLLAFTKKGTSIHSDFKYMPGDWLVFGSETSGLPPDVLTDCRNDVYGGGTLRIPMVDTYVRCLNLSVSVGIAIYEAGRQLNYEQLQSSPEAYVEGGKNHAFRKVTLHASNRKVKEFYGLLIAAHDLHNGARVDVLVVVTSYTNME